MRFKKLLSTAVGCTIAAGSVLSAPVNCNYASAEDPIKTDLKWYDEVITLVQDDVASNGQHAQWYYMTDNSAFRTDGLNVTYNQDVVTDDCEISFQAGDSPSKYYNGKSFEYDIPIDILYGGKDINSSVIAQIGRKDDANLDHLIDVRDAAIIARDVRTHIIFKKTEMTDFARFLVTGNRKNNVYALKSEDASSIAKDLAEKSLKGSIGKKLERADGTSGYSLSLSSAKGRPGETIAIQVVVSADNSLEALDAVVAWDGDSLKGNGLYAAKGACCQTAIGDGKMAVVAYGDDKIANGAVSTLSLTIPEEAKPGEDLELYFSDVNTFSVLGKDGSKDITDSVNIKGAKVSVLEPAATKPAVTTQAVTTTTTAATVTSVVPVTTFVPESTVTAISGFCFYPFNAELPNCTIVRPNKTVDMELTYDTINKVKATPVLPDGMKLVKAADKDGNELSIDEDGSFTVEGRKAILTIELPKDIEKGEYNVEVELDALNDYNKNIQYQLMLPNMPVGSIVGTITVKDEEVTTPVTTTSALTTTTTVTTTTAVTTPKTYQLGDANKDGKVDIRDAAHIAQILAKKKSGELDKTVADYNKDGKVNIRDAAAIAKYLSGKK